MQSRFIRAWWGTLLWGTLLSFSALAQGPALPLIPAPAQVQRQAGQFTIDGQTRLVAAGPDERRLATLLAGYLQRRFGVQPAVVDRAPARNFIEFTSASAQPTEGYRLTVEPGRVRVVGQGAGAFYGLQSLLQLLPVEGTPVLPALVIDDAPRFGYRGVMLDVGRHYFPVEFIEQLLDQMAFYKFNRLHWHLTEDQGWRLEIKRYPKLTQVGSRRKETLLGGYADRKPPQFDGVPHGGFYTQDEARRIVRYAAERHIEVIPEIEMPGHATAALAAYPELACTPGPFEVGTTWGVQKDVFCPTEATFTFLENVLSEVIDVFPSAYIHIGGDECPKDRWKASAFCQELIKREGLRDEHGLQSYFIRRIERFVNARGRRIIGWDEILEGGLAPNATVMSWRGEAGGIAAAKEQHDVIMTPNTYAYLDYHQARDRQREPLAIGGYLPLEKVYGYEPLPAALTPAEQAHIKGVQANLWTEYIATPAKAQYMLYPRALALAEVAWSPATRKSFASFQEDRLPVHLRRLEQEGVLYRVPAPLGVPTDTLRGPEHTLTLAPPVAGAALYYSLDGYEPDETTKRYTGPVRIPVPAGRSVTLRTLTITPAGRRSAPTRTIFVN
jgi:hexosaminidase